MGREYQRNFSVGISPINIGSNQEQAKNPEEYAQADALDVYGHFERRAGSVQQQARSCHAQAGERSGGDDRGSDDGGVPLGDADPQPYARALSHPHAHAAAARPAWMGESIGTSSTALPSAIPTWSTAIGNQFHHQR